MLSVLAKGNSYMVLDKLLRGALAAQPQYLGHFTRGNNWIFTYGLYESIKSLAPAQGAVASRSELCSESIPANSIICSGTYKSRPAHIG